MIRKMVKKVLGSLKRKWMKIISSVPLIVFLALLVAATQAQSSPSTGEKTLNSKEEYKIEEKYVGDLIIEGTQEYVIENKLFRITGNIIAKDSAKLIMKNAKVVVNNAYPWQYWIEIKDEATLIAENSVLESPNQMNMTGGGKFILQNFSTIGDIGLDAEGSIITIKNSERPFNQLFWKYLSANGYPPKFKAVNSTLKRISFHLGPIDRRRCDAENIELIGLRPGQIESMHFEISEGGVFELKDSSVEDWVIHFTSYSKKRITVKDSHLDSIWLAIFPDDSDVKLRDLKPTLYSDKMIHQNSLGGYLRLIHTRVDWYKFLLYGIDAIIENSRSFQVAPWGEAHVVVKDSIIDRGGVRLRGNETVRFENTFLKRGGIWFLNGKVHDPAHGGDTHIIEFSDSISNAGMIIACRLGVIKGNVRILARKVDFQLGTIVREYPIIVRDEKGNPLTNASVKLIDSEGRTVWSGKTDREGKTILSMEFTKENYAGDWTLEAIIDNTRVLKKLGFLSSTPIVLSIARAKFEIGNLSITPSEVKPNEPTIISVDVRNIGDVEGIYTVELSIGGKVVDSKSITLAPRESKKVSFSVARKEEGTYRVEIGDLTGSFEVKKPVKPAKFEVGGLRLSKTEVKPGGKVVVSATVTNVGGMKGDHDVKFYVAGELVRTKTVTLSPGESTVVQFITTKTEEGTYGVNIGGMTGSFEVRKLPKPKRPRGGIPLVPIVGGSAAAIAISVGIIAYIKRR